MRKVRDKVDVSVPPNAVHSSYACSASFDFE
jgi:hypothetical protein